MIVRSVGLFAVLAFLASPASAQLVGADTAPGDPCSLTGSATMSADPGGNGIVTLICNGVEWEPEKPTFVGSCNDGDQIVYDSSSGGMRCSAGGGGGGTLSGLSDVLITSPDDGVALIYDLANSRWINQTCDDVPNISFVDAFNQPTSTWVTSSIEQVTDANCTNMNIQITGSGSPQYRICNNASCSSVAVNWTTASNTVDSGDYIQLRNYSANTSETSRNATLTIGSSNFSWEVRTVGPKRVFVSSQRYNGDLGGIAGADAKCQSLANAAGLPGTFFAWLATSNADAPVNRFTRSTYEYKLVNGTKIADNWTDLTDGTIDNPIDRDENGVLRSGNLLVVTNVWDNGTVNYGNNAYNCDDWTEPYLNRTIRFVYGDTNRTDADWTEQSGGASQESCNFNKRLYCFEQ